MVCKMVRFIESKIVLNKGVLILWFLVSWEGGVAITTDLTGSGKSSCWMLSSLRT